MKQMVALSGKGGTGKTSLVAAMAHLASKTGPRLVLADADVDAANLELVLDPQRVRTESFISGFEANVEEEKCTACGKCDELCRFDAIIPGETYSVDPYSCEGCGVCATYCPVEAIRMEEPHCGDWFISKTRFGTLVHAGLFPGAENSGKLVTLVKSQAAEIAKDEGIDAILVDGPPGIGCPVIAASAGATAILAVTEPTPAGIHDLERLLDLAMHFRVPTVQVCINKFDLHGASTEEIERLCAEREIPIVGRIPFDESVVKTMIDGQPVTTLENSPAAGAIQDLWEDVGTVLES